MEIPTARIMQENKYRIGVSQIYPYRFYYGVLSPFKGLEIDGRITEVLGTNQNNGGYYQGYGNFKDKSLGFKYQLFSEGKYLPAIAIGIMDPHGTRVYSSQYIVFSKQIYPFDFTLGFGNGRFGKRPIQKQGEGISIEMLSHPKTWLLDSQFFWGIQFAPSDKYALMLEYSPIHYEKQLSDPASTKYFTENPVKSNFNVGVRWKPLNWAEIDLSYQRGNQIGVNFSMSFDIGKPLLPIYNHPYKEAHEDKANSLTERIITALKTSGFNDIGVIEENQDLWIEAQNSKYFFTTKAFGVILKIVDDTAPETINTVHILLKNNGIALSEMETIRADISELFKEKFTLNEFLYISKIKTNTTETLNTPKKYKSYISYGMKPSFQSFLNDPSGFFKYKVGLSAWISFHPWAGSSFIAGIEGYPVNNISTINTPLSIPVRSDIVLYEQKKLALANLMFDQIYKTKNEIFLRLSAGLLEIQYAGIDAEIARPVLDGRIIVGINGSAIKKRDPDNLFALKENNAKNLYSTLFFNTQLNIPEKEVTVDIKFGQFLAGDKGAKITVSKFIKGVMLSAWYSFTDTSIFSDEFNKGYHNKGIAVSIPLRLFKGADSKTSYGYALSPWTRDVAQDIYHHNDLFDFIGRDVKIYLDKDAGETLK